MTPGVYVLELSGYHPEAAFRVMAAKTSTQYDARSDFSCALSGFVADPPALRAIPSGSVAAVKRAAGHLSILFGDCSAVGFSKAYTTPSGLR